jgi:hypothetical protein
MGKRKTIKPVKAWGCWRKDGRRLVFEAVSFWSKHTAEWWAHDGKAIRVTVSVDDPAATRISAAQRRVVEAAVAMVGAAVVWRTNVVSIKSPYGRLINAVDALERAKGDRK